VFIGTHNPKKWKTTVEEEGTSGSWGEGQELSEYKREEKISLFSREYNKNCRVIQEKKNTKGGEGGKKEKRFDSRHWTSVERWQRESPSPLLAF